jgi:hypothetical protein
VAEGISSMLKERLLILCKILCRHFGIARATARESFVTKVKQMLHAAYSRDQAPSNFFFFSYLKKKTYQI